MTSSFDHPQPPPLGDSSANPRDAESFLTAVQHLVASCEPAVVFSSLAKLCVPAFSDECTVDVVQKDQTAYRINYPNRAAADGPGSSHVARANPGRQLSAAFDSGVEDDLGPRYSGVVTYTWRRATPGAADSVIARLLTDRAIAVIDQERQLTAVERACANIENLQTALASNRQIATAMGILMATNKITEADAFAMLRMASQQAHRKLRDIADGVVLTGGIEKPPNRLSG